MKKTVVYLTILALLLGGLLGGCKDVKDGDGGDDGKTPIGGNEEPDGGRQEPDDGQREPDGGQQEPADPNVLTAEELKVWEQRFRCDVYDEETGWSRSNPNALFCFFQDDWADPREMDLGMFLYYFPGEGLDSEEYREEAEELAASEGMTVEEYFEESMVLPTRIKASDVNAVLTKYAGVTWDQLSHAEHETYYEKYDVFYSWASDAPVSFVPVSGRRDGDLLILSSDPMDFTGRHDLTIRVDGDDWQFVSYLPSAEGYKQLSDEMMRDIERYFQNFYHVAVLGAEPDESLDLGTILYNEAFFSHIHIDDWRYEVSGGEMSMGEMFEAMHRLQKKAESLRDARGEGTVYEDLELSVKQTDCKFHTAHSATMWVDVEVSYTDAATGQRLSSQTSYAVDFVSVVANGWYIVNITEETGKAS